MAFKWKQKIKKKARDTLKVAKAVLRYFGTNTLFFETLSPKTYQTVKLTTAWLKC